MPTIEREEVDPPFHSPAKLPMYREHLLKTDSKTTDYDALKLGRKSEAGVGKKNNLNNSRTQSQLKSDLKDQLMISLPGQLSINASRISS